MIRSADNESRPLGLVWILCSYPIVAAGLERSLERRARVHLGWEAPKESPSFVIFDAGDAEGLAERMERIRKAAPDVPVLAFGLHMDLHLAWSALHGGARGFAHAGMQPEQVVRAVEVAAGGKLAAPREMLEYLVAGKGPEKEPINLSALTNRQRDVLDHVAEGLSNAEIAKRVFLSESTVKQHLRAAYKVLGVSNRAEAVRLVRDAD